MDENKLKTNKFIYGSWKSIPSKVYNNYNGTINIDEKKLAIILFVNDERKYKLSIDSSTWWVEDYLCFTDDPRFYVLSANETEMVFGEFKNLGNIDGNIKWQLKFERII